MEIGTEAAQFPEKEYINGIFLAVWYYTCLKELEGDGGGYWDDPAQGTEDDPQREGQLKLLA